MPNRKIVSWLLPFIVLIFAYGMQRSVALIGLDLHHDTFMFDAASRMLHGEIPFADYFYQYNLGTVFLHLLALKVLGVKIASLKIITVYAYAFIAISIYACSTIQGRLWWAFAVAMLWSTLSPFHMPALNGYHAWSTVYMMVAVMGGAYALAKGIGAKQLVWSVLAGVLFNIAFWFKQVAAIQIILIFLWLTYNAKRPLATQEYKNKFSRMLLGFIFGGLVSSLPYFYYINEQSLFYYWFQSAFVFNGMFAVTGHSSTGIVAFARTIFPVASDVGYVSIIWAILPLFLLATVIVPSGNTQELLFKRTDTQSLRTSIFAVLGIAGWIEYYPLAHSFHTQLFMAPVFVLLTYKQDVMGADGETITGKRFFIYLTIFITLTSITYESIKHLRGLITKISNQVEPIAGNIPVSGLKFSYKDTRNFEAFYRKFVAAKKDVGNLPFIPMSVDSLSALLPEENRETSVFKMGFNWTWPNEIVEPGFNINIEERIAERKSPIYADSLIGILGYIPVALLNMPSPLTASHTLYIPSQDKSVTDPQMLDVYNCGYASNEIFTEAEAYSISQSTQPHALNYFPIGEQGTIPINEIDQIHVSIVRRSDFPDVLSKYQYENYLLAMSSDLSSKVASLYERNIKDKYTLQFAITSEQSLSLAKFLLSHGKLFKQFDLPLYFTTLTSSPEKQPFLARAVQGAEYYRFNGKQNSMRIAWAKFTYLEQQNSTKYNKDQIYLVMPAITIQPDEEAFIYVQIVLKSRTTQNYLIRYLQG